MQQMLPFHGDQDLPGPYEGRGPMQTAGLFAGIGGIEHGLRMAGHHSRLLCEIDPAANEVLRLRFSEATIANDVARLETVEDVDLIAAGFPCQDLSISGQRAGIGGKRSSLVSHVFRLFDTAKSTPSWILMENVPFLLQLQGGRGMQYLIEELESRDLRWAYRIVDTRAFGIPHRRNRILILASPTENPRDVLLADDSFDQPRSSQPNALCGFYWTEGNRGVGWSEDCVPPIKVGSGLAIPSAPAIWDPVRRFAFKLHIRDAERLQGFEPGWTEPAARVGREGDRWRLVGNSVSVPLGRWIGESLRKPAVYDYRSDWPLDLENGWPESAWGENGERYVSSVTSWPVCKDSPSLATFLSHEGPRLSPRAGAGLLRRIENGSSNVPESFLAYLRALSSEESDRLREAERKAIADQIRALERNIRSEESFARKVRLQQELAELRCRHEGD